MAVTVIAFRRDETKNFKQDYAMKIENNYLKKFFCKKIII